MSVCKGAPLGVALIALGLHGAAAQDLTSKKIREPSYPRTISSARRLSMNGRGPQM